MNDVPVRRASDITEHDLSSRYMQWALRVEAEDIDGRFTQNADSLAVSGANCNVAQRSFLPPL